LPSGVRTVVVRDESVMPPQASSSWRRRLIGQQRRWSRWLDRLLPAAMAVDGNDEFRDVLLPSLIRPGLRIYDVGGGAHPYISAAQRAALGLVVVGLDISAEELASAPEGSYDATVCADLTSWRGVAEADLVICQATLEHVADVPAAMSALAGIVRPGGVVAMFVPCRNAAYARLNLLLPEAMKRWLLDRLAESAAHGGFPARYHRCTPDQIAALARAAGFEVTDLRLYWRSGYFEFFAPLHALWRLWTLFAYGAGLRRACESFAIVARGTGDQAGARHVAGVEDQPSKAHPAHGLSP
jgi:2-polyprenyl-3-methyl-5-hydroxy-6-metoxy-1,4-benzoquinol methylase